MRCQFNEMPAIYSASRCLDFLSYSNDIQTVCFVIRVDVLVYNVTVQANHCATLQNTALHMPVHMPY